LLNTVHSDKITSDGATGTGCQLCGTCCTKGGPAFHTEDRDLIEKGAIPAKYLYTIRKGEPVRDNVRGGIAPAPAEIIKLKGSKGSWTCCFLDESKNRCRIYDDRPVECRALMCWDTRAIEALYDKNRLIRKDLLRGIEGLWHLIEDHEKRCAYREVRTLVNALAGENRADAADRMLKMIKYDKHLRLLVTEKAGMDPEMTDFLFGRPLIETIRMFGVKIQREGEKIVLKG